MSPDLLKSIIGAAGTAVGALLVAFKDDIKNLILSMFSSKNEYLKGDWQCKWTVTSGVGVGRAINDRVTIESVRGAALKGKGHDSGSFGEYDIQGNVSRYVVTLNYDGKRDKQGLVGVVILKQVARAHLEGVWSQYAESGDLNSGTTDWHKA